MHRPGGSSRRRAGSVAVGEEETHNVSFGSTFQVNAPGQMQIAA